MALNPVAQLLKTGFCRASCSGVPPLPTTQRLYADAPYRTHFTAPIVRRAWSGNGAFASVGLGKARN